MAEETKTEAAKTEETPAPSNTNKGGRNNKKDETPIEELYDLSKPIPKVGSGTEPTCCACALRDWHCSDST